MHIGWVLTKCYLMVLSSDCTLHADIMDDIRKNDFNRIKSAWHCKVVIWIRKWAPHLGTLVLGKVFTMIAFISSNKGKDKVYSCIYYIAKQKCAFVHASKKLVCICLMSPWKTTNSTCVRQKLMSWHEKSYLRIFSITQFWIKYFINQKNSDSA